MNNAAKLTLADNIAKHMNERAPEGAQFVVELDDYCTRLAISMSVMHGDLQIRVVDYVNIAEHTTPDGEFVLDCDIVAERLESMVNRRLKRHLKEGVQ